MKTTPRAIVSVISFIFMLTFSIIYQPLTVHGASLVTTDKDVYNYGDQIKVNYSDAPGIDGDWICVVPAGSPDTEGGDFKYLPVGKKK